MILVMIRELVTLLSMFVEDLLQFAENAPVSHPAGLNIPLVSDLKLASVPHQHN